MAGGVQRAADLPRQRVAVLAEEAGHGVGHRARVVLDPATWTVVYGDTEDDELSER